MAFFDNLFHIPRCLKLTFFDIDRFAAASYSLNKIGLTYKESRCLQNINNACNFFYWSIFMDVSENPQAVSVFHFLQDLQTTLHSWAAETIG